MKATGTRTSQEMVTTMCHPGPISAPAHDPRPLSGLGMQESERLFQVILWSVVTSTQQFLTLLGKDSE